MSKRVEIGRAAAHVLFGLKAVLDAKAGSSSRHELHEALSAGTAHGAGIAIALGLYHAGQQVNVQVVLLAGAGENLAQVGGVSFAAFGAVCGVKVRSRRGRIGNEFDGGDLFGRKLDVVVLAGAEIEANASLDLGVVVALLDEAVAQCDPLGGARRQPRRALR